MPIAPNTPPREVKRGCVKDRKMADGSNQHAQSVSFITALEADHLVEESVSEFPIWARR